MAASSRGSSRWPWRLLWSCSWTGFQVVASSSPGSPYTWALVKVSWSPFESVQFVFDTQTTFGRYGYAVHRRRYVHNSFFIIKMLIGIFTLQWYHMPTPWTLLRKTKCLAGRSWCRAAWNRATLTNQTGPQQGQFLIKCSWWFSTSCFLTQMQTIR